MPAGHEPSFTELIRRKRDGEELDAADLSRLVAATMSGEIPDYQLSAWLMAVFFRGLSLNETVSLTDALVDSGRRIDLSSLGRKVVDKHSTGGVGDKVTLVLAPLVASCGAVFGKMSGRALGHTGGTFDKLESIPGMRMTLSADEFAAQLAATGICVCGQSPELAPADERLYALRDVTATIESNPLIAASIMSKKIASGAAAVVLDVKVGSGAFFKNIGTASGASHIMAQIGELRGIDIIPVLSSMEQPLGRAVGNALEVEEAVAVLKGEGPADVAEVVLELASRLLPFAGLGWDRERSHSEAARRLADGSALAKFREWITAQGGDPAFIDDPGRLPQAAFVIPVEAPSTGYVAAIDALQIGLITQELGAGRTSKGQAIDHSVGVVLAKKAGERVEAGEPLAHIHAAGKAAGDAAASSVLQAYTLSEEKSEPAPLLIG